MDIILSERAKKKYNHLTTIEQRKIKKKLHSLAPNSLSGKKLSGELTGDRSLRLWPYRIIYSINKNERKVEVSDILHRQGAYK